MFGKVRNFLLKMRKSFKNRRFFNEKGSKGSSGHSECSFDEPCGIDLPKVHFFYSKIKITEKSAFFQFFFSKFFSGHVDWSFENPAVNVWQSPELFRSMCENQSKIIVFSMKKAQKVPLDTLNAALTNPAELIWPKSNFFYSKYKITENSAFFSVFFCLKIFLRTRRLKFRKPCRKFLTKSGTFSLKVRKSFKKHRFFNEKCSKISSGHAECIFDNPCQTVLPKVYFSNSEYKITEKSSFFHFMSKVSPDT